MQALIFLDIDGVLTNADTKYRFGHPNCVVYLNHITTMTGAKIVVSSTWRSDPKIANVLEEWGVDAEVIGVTPQGARESKNGIWSVASREDEIQAWLDQNPGEWNYMILDDESFDLFNLRHRLVQTDTHKGLTEKDVNRAIDLLTEGENQK